MTHQLDTSFTMKDDIKTTLRHIKGELTLDGVYLGEIILDTIRVSNANFILIEFNLHDISLALFSSMPHSINFQSEYFKLECDNINYSFREDVIIVVMHRTFNSSLKVTINPEGE